MTETKKSEELTFEEAMKGLEGIVAKLEEGDVPLEQAINYFQEGMAFQKCAMKSFSMSKSKWTLF